MFSTKRLPAYGRWLKKRNYTPPNLLDFLSPEPLQYTWSWRVWWKPFWVLFMIQGFILRTPGAQAKLNVKEIDRVAQLSSKTTSAAFDVFWDSQMADWLYIIRVSLTIFGIFAILWLALHTIRQADQRGFIPVRTFIIVAAMLVLINSGDLMKASANSVRLTLNKTGENVLELIGSQDRVEQAKALSSYPAVISSQVKQCEGIAPNPSQSACLNATAELGSELLELDRQRFGNQPWIDAKADSFSQISSVGGSASVGTTSQGEQFLNGVVDGVMSVAEEFIFFVLDLLGEGFQALIEYAYILTAFLLPIALLLSCSPLEAAPLLAWTAGMVAVGFHKFCYNLLVAIAADILINSNGALHMLFAFLTGLLAPVLTVLVAAGGGMAIIIGILQFASFAANSGSKLRKRAYSGA